MDEPPLSFRPAVWFYRDSIEQSHSCEGLRRIARALCEEVEYRNKQIRDLGGIPQRVYDPVTVGPEGIEIEDERQIELRLG